MAKQINVSIGGVKKSTKVYACIGNVIKQIKKGVCGVGGVVKEFFTGETVLWNGSSLQNGATWSGSMLQYKSTNAAFQGKKLEIIPKKNMVAELRVQCIVNNTSSGIEVFDINGTKNGSNFNWVANTVYTLDLSKVGKYTSMTGFNVFFVYDGTYRKIADNISSLSLL